MPTEGSTDNDNTAAAFAGLDEKWWYVIAGGVIFIGLVGAVVWGLGRKPKKASASISMGGDVTLGAGYVPVSPTGMPSMMVGGTPNQAMNTPYSMGPGSPNSQYAEPMQSFFPPGNSPVPRNESMVSNMSHGQMTLWQYFESKERGKPTEQVRSPVVSRNLDGRGLLLTCATPDVEIYYTVDKSDPVPPTRQPTHTSSVYIGDAARAEQGALNAVRRVLQDNLRGSSSDDAAVGAGTHRYDQQGPNNLLRFQGKKSLEVRCVSVKNGMVNSLQVRHVDQQSVQAIPFNNPEPSSSPAAAKPGPTKAVVAQPESRAEPAKVSPERAEKTELATKLFREIADVHGDYDDNVLDYEEFETAFQIAQFSSRFLSLLPEEKRAMIDKDGSNHVDAHQLTVLMEAAGAHDHKITINQFYKLMGLY